MINLILQYEADRQTEALAMATRIHAILEEMFEEQVDWDMVPYGHGNPERPSFMATTYIFNDASALYELASLAHTQALAAMTIFAARNDIVRHRFVFLRGGYGDAMGSQDP